MPRCLWQSWESNPNYIRRKCHMSTKADLSDEHITEEELHDKYYEGLTERHLRTGGCRWPVHEVDLVENLTRSAARTSSLQACRIKRSSSRRQGTPQGQHTCPCVLTTHMSNTHDSTHVQHTCPCEAPQGQHTCCSKASRAPHPRRTVRIADRNQDVPRVASSGLVRTRTDSD